MSVILFVEDERSPLDYMAPSRWLGSTGPPYDVKVGPRAYLDYAIADVKDSGDRGLVNAFGNIKRYFHLTVDMLLHQYGLYVGARKQNFPTRLRLLDEIDVLPTSILENLNVERNLVEHEYTVPERQRVEEAIDVAKLLELAVQRLLERVPVECVVGWRSPRRHAVMRIEPGSGSLDFYRLTAPNMYKTAHGLRYFSGHLRTLRDDRVRDGVRISSEPWRRISLGAGHIELWRPILRDIVDLQRGTPHGFILRPDEGTVTTSITLPFPLDGAALADFIDAGMPKRD